jgi:hypothetical protein
MANTMRWRSVGKVKADLQEFLISALVGGGQWPLSALSSNKEVPIIIQEETGEAGGAGGGYSRSWYGDE